MSERLETDMGWPATLGLGTWPYTRHHEPHLSRELERLALARTVGDTDCVCFQPSPNPAERSQDRYFLRDVELSDGTWSLRGVLDGHAGHETVDYVSEALPSKISELLTSATDLSSPSVVTSVLQQAIQSIDETIAAEIVELFPDEDILASLTNEDIKKVINDGGENSTRVVRGMRGTTVLVSLLDPKRSNLWVASLGDSQATIAWRQAPTEWNVRLLSSNHNGTDHDEVERIRREHPGEAEAVLRDRVLGAIAVTRAIGDHEFKLPKVYTDKVFLNSDPGFSLHSKVEDFMLRSLTPPYLSNLPDVCHVNLEGAQEAFLIMCSDGLMDLYEPPDRREGGFKLEALARQWSDLVQDGLGQKATNSALHLLRDALGGADESKVSRMMTVEMEGRWMDDTTILVEKIRER